MNLLAIDTCTRRVGIAIANDDGVVGQLALGGMASRGAPRHVEQLAPAIRHLVDQCSVSFHDLDAVVVTIGPGMFTGLRVGVVTACTLAAGLGIDVVPVVSLDVMAHSWRNQGSQVVIPMIDARRAEVYVAQYRVDSGRVTAEALPDIATPESVRDDLIGPNRPEGSVVVCGDGALRFAELFTGIDGCTLADGSYAYPSLDSLVDLGTRRWRDGAVVAPAEVRPVYVRHSDAEINVAKVAGGMGGGPR